jgi:two-component system chemotaxis response regulator CheB
MRSASEITAAKMTELRQYPGGDFDVVALGASAGGFNALSRLLGPLPEGFGSSILVVQHLSPDYRSVLAELLERKTRLHVHQASDGEKIIPGVVYVAAPNLHLLAEPGAVRLLRTPAVHHSRPSIDLLFESVAVNYGQRAMGIVLSGSGRDGAAGIQAIKAAGGTTMAEDPATSEFSSMPYAAIATGCVDIVLPIARLAKTLIELCGTVAHD